jgi:glycosyltransferase involved in cell wall biosynthesis
VSTDVDRLRDALRRYGDDPASARADGLRARAYALERYGLRRFLAAWDRLFSEVTS